MAEIIEFHKKAQDLKSMQNKDLQKRKIEALRKVFQCTRCMVRCTKCGVQLESQDMKPETRYAAPYHFCTNCHSEYDEYRQRLEGKQKGPSYYWHNDSWMRVWETWLEHQETLDCYRKSKEFLQLLEEVEELLGR